MNINDAQALAAKLMTEHKLDSKGWVFKFDKGTCRFGRCSYSNRVITLSRSLTLSNAETEVRDTILHEIAHALVGPRHGHDSLWRAQALKIGCNGKRFYKTAGQGGAVVVNSPWVLVCDSCGERYPKQKKSTERHYICKACSRKAGASCLLRWEATEYLVESVVSSRPQSGVTLRVWQIADEVQATGAVPLKLRVMKRCLAEGINRSTAQIQYAKWLKSWLKSLDPDKKK